MYTPVSTKSQRVTLFRTVNEGDRVAQLIIERIYTPEVQEVQVRCKGVMPPFLSDTRGLHLQDLEETVRGAGGFGSTGGHVLLEKQT